MEVFFEGTIDTVDAGKKEIGERIKGSFRYEFDAEGRFPSPLMTYPLRTNFRAFPLPMSIDENLLSYQYGGTSISLVDWINEAKEYFGVYSSGYISESRSVWMECDFEGPDLFDSLFILPNPPKFTNLSLARFSFSISIPSNLNVYQEKYSGAIESISTVVHPEEPEVQILEIGEYEITVHYYGNLHHSYDLKEWTDSYIFPWSGSMHTYTFLGEKVPKSFFVRATE